MHVEPVQALVEHEIVDSHEVGIVEFDEASRLHERIGRRQDRQAACCAL